MEKGERRWSYGEISIDRWIHVFDGLDRWIDGWMNGYQAR